MKIKVVKTFLIVAVLSAAASAQAGIIDFAAAAEDNEGAASSLVFGDLFVVLSGNIGTPYLDDVNDRGLPAGLGECKIFNSAGLCAPSRDDNVTFEEALTLSFFQNVDGEQGEALTVTLSDVVFRGEFHQLAGDPLGDIDLNETLLFGADGASSEVLFGSSINASGHSFTFGFGGERPEQFYISTLVANAAGVPEPESLGMIGFGLGLLPLLRRRANRR